MLLDGDASRAYLDGDQIVQRARNAGAQAIIPGYGFLSENADFARSVAAAGLDFVGPSPESIEQFGLKHMARELALAADVPVVPGTKGLLMNVNDATKAAEGLGYPVMLKSTAGGGGMGLQTCADESELRKAFQTVQSRGKALFKNAGVFLEKYYPAAHHIEVQVFGNGQGKVATLGERECSIQRRHQKVIEECPSPFVVQKRPGLRKQLCAAATSLAESIKYSSAGTLEFLVDDESGAFFFLEMNTRLQVEHGVTEMAYGVDLVELMLRQADAQLAGKGGLEVTELEDLSRSCQEPKGHAIEVRVYAENPAREYAPSPGLLQQVTFHELPGTRIDSWVRAGLTISPNYGELVEWAPRTQLLTMPTRSVTGKGTSSFTKQIANCRGAYDSALKVVYLWTPYQSRFSTCNSELSRVQVWQHYYTVPLYLCVPSFGHRRASWRLLHSRRRLSRPANYRQRLRTWRTDGSNVISNC